MRPIRVLFDQQIFLLQRFGGISRYFTQLIKTYLEHPELGVVPVVESKTTFNQHLSDELRSWGFSRDNSRTVAILRILLGLINRNKTRNTVDVAHLTFYLPGYFSRGKDIARVVTLFDMIPERVPAMGRLWNPHFQKRHFLNRADAVVSISETSTKDMFKDFGIFRPIPTTYLGVTEEFAPNLERIDGMNQTYFLYVGARGGYKDFRTALEAFADYSKASSGVHFVFVGGGKPTAQEERLFRALGISGYVSHITISDARLPQLYSNAAALIYPSVYEGFGLPLVEAMASGIPILASDTEINREIAQDIANYFAPGDASALAEGMQLILTNPSSQATKIEAGLVRSKNFTWLECARQTAEVYKDVLQKGKVGN